MKREVAGRRPMTRQARPESWVRALWRRVAVQLGLAALTGTLAALGGLFLAGWAAGATSVWRRPSFAPLLLWMLVTALVAAWLWRIGVCLRRWGHKAAAAEIEARLDLAPGTVQGAIEPGLQRPGISRSLVDLHRARVACRLAGRRARELGSGFANAARTYALAGVALALASVVSSSAVWLAARESAREAWAAVLHPVRHLSAPPLPALRLTADIDRVRRGRDLPVSVSASERDSVQLVWQPLGEVAQRRWHAVNAGTAAAIVPHIDAPTRVWATAADGALSDTLQVTPVDPLLLLNVRVTLRYPPHTRREQEVVSAPLPPFVVPEGTRASVSGVTTRPLGAVALRSSSGTEIGLRLSGDRRFSGRFTVRPGTWGWEISGAHGESLEGDPDSLYFTTVPDSVPLVRVVYPGVDTVLNTDMVQPLLIDASDDYGLSRVELVSWRVSAWGEHWPEAVEPIALEGDARAASLTAMIDARGRGFLPGDTLRYFVRAYDNAPEPNIGTSREFVLRLPTLDEVRERAVTDAKDLVEATERLAERARAQEESTQALERSTEVQPAPGADPRSVREESLVEFRDTESARQALEEAAELLDEAREIQESLRDLQQSIEDAGLNDTSVLERLREIQSLYERILTPELEQKIEQLREALVDLDPQRIREAIQQLAEGSVDFRERIEQSLELLRRAALETEFEALETRAEELKDAHDQLAQTLSESEAVADSLSERWARQAEDLAQRAETLSEQVQHFTQELRRAGEQRAAERTDEAQAAAAEAARADRRTAGAADRRRQAARSADRAATQMQRSASALQEGREGMQESWRQEVVQALERAKAEALELARRQQGLNERLDSNDPLERATTRSDQVALKRGVDQLRQQLSNTSRSSLLLDPSVIDQGGRASASLDELLRQLGDGTRAGRADPQLGQQAAEALNELAYRLMQAGDAAAAAQSGTGLQDALEQLAELAEQQGDLNAETGGITPGAITEMILQELQRLAGRQRAIAEELMQLERSMGPRGQVLGRLDALGREAEELAREMERGRLDQQIIERQGELFQRLLDAGRTLERDEFEKVRRAERPGATEILQPDDLPAELLRGTRFPLPPQEVLRLYPPAYRRLIIEYFDRLNGRGGAGGS